MKVNTLFGSTFNAKLFRCNVGAFKSNENISCVHIDSLLKGDFQFQRRMYTYVNCYIMLGCIKCMCEVIIKALVVEK